MGTRIFVLDESAPIPRQTVLELTCDGEHGLFGVETFRAETGDFVEQRHAATLAGWRVQESGRILGPCCARC